MGNLFKDLTGGFASFVLAWLVPSALVVGLFAILIYPPLVNSPQASGHPFAPIQGFIAGGAVASTAVLTLAIVAVALVTSLASRPLYRFLEGYTLPRFMIRRLKRRQIRRRREILIRTSNRRRRDHHGRLLALEELANYPTNIHWILPTRLGNALKALETYGTNNYRLDSQTFWYEIYGSAPEQTCRDADHARASVDFFISILTLLGMLSITSLVSAKAVNSLQCLYVGLGASLFMRPAYSAAVRNMTDWRYAVQALINMSRSNLAAQLGYVLPLSISEERELWAAWTSFVERGEVSTIADFDHYRQVPPPTAGGADPVRGLGIVD